MLAQATGPASRLTRNATRGECTHTSHWSNAITTNDDRASLPMCSRASSSASAAPPAAPTSLATVGGTVSVVVICLYVCARILLCVVCPSPWSFVAPLNTNRPTRRQGAGHQHRAVCGSQGAGGRAAGVSWSWAGDLLCIFVVPCPCSHRLLGRRLCRCCCAGAGGQMPIVVKDVSSTRVDIVNSL